MEVLEREARVFRSGLLGGLPFHHRDHGGHRHLLSTPHPQGRRRPRPKKLHFRAVLGEGVPGNEEAEHRFFPYQALVLGPGGYVRDPGARSRELGRLAEECVLTGEPFLLTDLGFAERMIERRDQLRALTVQ